MCYVFRVILPTCKYINNLRPLERLLRLIPRSSLVDKSRIFYLTLCIRVSIGCRVVRNDRDMSYQRIFCTVRKRNSLLPDDLAHCIPIPSCPRNRPCHKDKSSKFLSPGTSEDFLGVYICRQLYSSKDTQLSFNYTAIGSLISKLMLNRRT